MAPEIFDRRPAYRAYCAFVAKNYHKFGPPGEPDQFTPVESAELESLISALQNEDAGET